MKKIYITRKYPSIAKDLLSKKFDVEENLENRTLTKDELIQVVKNYDGILSSVCDRFDQEVLSQNGKLQVISNYGIGLDNIDLDFAKKQSVAVYNLPDIVTNSTADLCLAAFLSFIRKIPEASQYVRQGKWVDWDPDVFVGEELNNKTFGIYGFGRIGKAVTRRILPFGVKVIFYHHRPITLDPEFQGKVTQVEFDELLNESDYLSLHIPLTDQTKESISDKEFSKMNKKPVLINMARGAVVSTDALLKALKTKQIRGAVLDVTDPEPLPIDHPLLKVSNCLITPHVGTSTLECRYNKAKIAAENLLNHFSC